MTTTYREQLQALHKVVLSSDCAPTEPISWVRTPAPGQCQPTERLAAYSQGYVHRLVECVLADYPGLVFYLSEKTVRQLAYGFVQSTPSTHWDLNQYPVKFAHFVAEQILDPAACELARLESVILSTFWEPDSESLKPDALAKLSETQLGTGHFHLRTASHLMQLQWGANQWLTQFRSEEVTPNTPLTPQVEYVLVIRLDNEVKRELLEPSEYAILLGLHQGFSFIEAMQSVTDQATLPMRLPGYTQRWFQRGYFSSQVTDVARQN